MHWSYSITFFPVAKVQGYPHVAFAPPIKEAISTIYSEALVANIRALFIVNNITVVVLILFKDLSFNY